jgi:hypothetical protein
MSSNFYFYLEDRKTKILIKLMDLFKMKSNKFTVPWKRPVPSTQHKNYLSLVITMCSSHDVHEMNAYRAGHVCLSVRLCVCPHNSTREPLNGFGWILVWKLCHWGLPYNRTFQFSAIGNTNIADEQTREIGSTLAPLAIGPYSNVWF